MDWAAIVMCAVFGLFIAIEVAIIMDGQFFGAQSNKGSR